MLLNFRPSRFKCELKSGELGKELAKIQRKMLGSDKKISLIVMVEGWESSGRGNVMKDIIRELDQRYVHAYADEYDGFDWPYNHKLWDGLPEYGKSVIYSRSFYTPILRNTGLSDRLLEKHLEPYKRTAKALYDDNVILIKLFLDVSEETQLARIEEFFSDAHTRLYVSKNDLRENTRYDAVRAHFSRVLNKTNYVFSPWHIISAEDLKCAGEEALTIIIQELNKGIDRIEKSTPKVKRSYKEKKNWLNAVNPNREFSYKQYKDKLEPLQEKAAEIQLRLKNRKIPTVIVFEGMDAAGKGGSIKRLTRLMDPRFSHVATTAAPTDHENAHHYLWRFYNAFPRYGNTTIFDRSWYGRVLVERVEGFAKEHEWERAFDEINTMEKELVLHNCLVLKYYLHIDKDEQEARFNKRMTDKAKHYKITEEDWRNRDKWDRYWNATNEMLARTSTDYAPWVVVPGNNKRFARISILEDYIKRGEAALKDTSLWSIFPLD